MGMYDTFWGKYICPGCNKEIQFEEQTKDYERCLEDFKLGDYIDRGNRNYFYDFTYECPCCGEETELSIGIRHGQYVVVYFTEEARKIDPNTLENIEDGYQRHREYEEKCREMLGSARIEAKEVPFAPYKVGETIKALEADWKVLEAYKEEYVGYPEDEEKRELHMKLFYHPSYVYRVKNGETFRIIVIRLNSWNKAMWYEVYEDNFEQLDERARLDGTYPHRYFIQYECELKRI